MKKIESKGNVFVVSAPSGAGKTTLINKLITTNLNYELVTSYTTRAKRSNVSDSHYTFIEEKEFRSKIANGQILEYSESYGYLYGTPELDYKKILGDGKIIFFEVNWEGARQIRKRFEGLIHIYILPTSQEVLIQRLEGRNDNNKKDIARRMDNALEEMSHYVEADYLIFNNDINIALAELSSIVTSHQLSIEAVLEKKQNILNGLFNNEKNNKEKNK